MSSAPEVYLDSAATTRTDPEAAGIALRMMTEDYGNPSSRHFLGAQAYRCLTTARSQVAQVLGAPARCIAFTSGGTEGNSLLLRGVMERQAKGKGLVTTAIEHSSVLAAADRLEDLGCPVKRVPPGPAGRTRPEDIAAAVDENTALVSVIAVNNETGEILPLAEIAAAVRAKNPAVLLHTDFVQGFGKLPRKVWEMGVDLLTLSGHKVHAPKGVGAVYVREGIPLLPLQRGGRQEQGLRPGTEPVPLACALGTAAQKALAQMAENDAHVRMLRGELVRRLKEIPGAVVNSFPDGSPYLLNLSIPGLDADEAVSRLSRRHIYLSKGAACAKGEESHVLKAMGLPPERRRSALRVSLDRENTPEQMALLVQELKRLTGERP